jgi:carboxyl-terminal processing protease
MDSNTLQDLQGAWQSHGYGWIVEIAAEQVKLYDYCKSGCLLVDSHSNLVSQIANSNLERAGANSITLFPKGAVTKYTFDRIDRVPTLLDENAKKDPITNFEFFWDYFNENYAFFELRKTNWGQIYQEFRPKINPSTTDAQLLDIFKEILQKLGDMHVSLHAGEEHIESARPTKLHLQWQKEFEAGGMMEMLLKGFGHLIEFICTDILKGQFKKAANDFVVWGKLENNIGYLFIPFMAGYAGFENENVDDHLQVLSDAMDAVMEDLKNCDGIILDMRFNHGGFDPASQIIANRFADQKRVGFYKQAVFGKGRTKQQPIYLDPQGKPPYTRSVVLLTSDSTISAAEIFTLFMMALPHVTRMGEPTQGVLSDILGKTLPNGWQVGLSNEIYTAIDGIVYESMGIPPDIEIPVYSEEHFYETLAALVEQAAGYLVEKAGKS